MQAAPLQGQCLYVTHSAYTTTTPSEVSSRTRTPRPSGPEDKIHISSTFYVPQEWRGHLFCLHRVCLKGIITSHCCRLMGSVLPIHMAYLICLHTSTYLQYIDEDAFFKRSLFPIGMFDSVINCWMKTSWQWDQAGYSKEWSEHRTYTCRGISSSKARVQWPAEQPPILLTEGHQALHHIAKIHALVATSLILFCMKNTILVV